MGWPEAKIHLQIQRWAYIPRALHRGALSVLECLSDPSLEQTRVEMITKLSFLMKSANIQRIVFQMTHFCHKFCFPLINEHTGLFISLAERRILRVLAVTVVIHVIAQVFSVLTQSACLVIMLFDQEG